MNHQFLHKKRQPTFRNPSIIFSVSLGILQRPEVNPICSDIVRNCFTNFCPGISPGNFQDFFLEVHFHSFQGKHPWREIYSGDSLIINLVVFVPFLEGLLLWKNISKKKKTAETSKGIPGYFSKGTTGYLYKKNSTSSSSVESCWNIEKHFWINLWKISEEIQRKLLKKSIEEFLRNLGNPW